MIADIFITTVADGVNGDRADLFLKSLNSLADCTERQDFRLTLVLDGVANSSRLLDAFAKTKTKADHVIAHAIRQGLGPSMNDALIHIESMKRWEGEKASPLTVYVQDDVLYQKGWLRTLRDEFMRYQPLNLGFATGVTCPEHPVRRELSEGKLLKDWIRATNLMAFHKYWMSMWPIPPTDEETGQLRGMPHNGLGSGVDWHFIRVHSNSVCKTGRTNLVVPGLLVHDGYDKSTWLRRHLPETDCDLEKIDAARKALVI